MCSPIDNSMVPVIQLIFAFVVDKMGHSKMMGRDVFKWIHVYNQEVNSQIRLLDFNNDILKHSTRFFNGSVNLLN